MVFALVKASEASHSFPLDHVGTSGKSIKPRLQVLPIENNRRSQSSAMKKKYLDISPCLSKQFYAQQTFSQDGKGAQLPHPWQLFPEHVLSVLPSSLVYPSVCSHWSLWAHRATPEVADLSYCPFDITVVTLVYFGRWEGDTYWGFLKRPLISFCYTNNMPSVTCGTRKALLGLTPAVVSGHLAHCPSAVSEACSPKPPLCSMVQFMS